MSRLIVEAIESPVIPFVTGIPGGVRPGLIIRIQGFVPYNSERFDVNLCTGPEVSGSYRSDIAFHFNPRFGECYVARNTLVNGEWGSEESRHPSALPFSRDRPFEIMLLVEPERYKVGVDGEHFLEYLHRIPLEDVNTLYIGGNVEIYKIEIMEPQPLGFGQLVQAEIQETLNPMLPFKQSIPGRFLPGKSIFITARPKPYANRFSINLKCDETDDIALHFNPRFGGMSEEQISVIVRNSRYNDEWGNEERETPYFPFQPGFNFDLLLRCEEADLLVAVNGQHLITFRHRLPFQIIDTLKIEGDLDMMIVRV